MRGCGSCRPMSGCGSCLPARVDHIDLTEAARHTAVAHRVDLSGLALPVEEARAHLIAGLSADHVHGVPEIGRTHLIGHILQHAGDLAALDLVEDLTPELRVVALLVDGERSVTNDRDALVGGGDEIIPSLLLLPRK